MLASLTVSDVSPIFLANPGRQINSVGDSGWVQLGCHGIQCRPTLTYSQSGLPTGLSLNTSTGLISGTTQQAAIRQGIIRSRYRSPMRSSTATQTFTWTLSGVAGRRSTTSSSVRWQPAFRKGYPLTFTVAVSG